MTQQTSGASLFSFLIFLLCNSTCISLPTDSLCTELSIYQLTRQTTPSSGMQLPYCRTSDLQCCTSNYLDTLKSEKALQISTGIQTDLRNAFQPWQQSYAKLTGSLKSFIVQFIDSYPFPHSVVEDAQTYLNTMKPLLREQLVPTSTVINMTYNFTEFVSDLTFTLVDIFVNKIEITDTQRTCLRETINNEIRLDALESISNAMVELQKVYQSFEKIGTFLDTINIEGLGYTTSDQCLEAILSQRCEQCKTDIPTLCDNVCTSLIVACLSPLQDGLKSQIETVWNITRQLTLLTQQQMTQILRIYQPLILPVDSLHTLATNAHVNCGVNLLNILGSGKRKRLVDSIPLPADLESAVTDVLAIKGLFIFNGNSLPSYCSQYSNNNACWNGQKETENGTVTSDNIQKPGINDQRDNPVYQFDLYTFYKQAASIGNPTSSFLQSPDLLNDLPVSVLIPLINPYEPPATISATSATTTIDPTSSNTLTTTPSSIPHPPSDITGSSASIINNSYYVTLFMIMLLYQFS